MTDPTERLRSCWSCSEGTMRCSGVVTHLVNGVQTGFTYVYTCDGCQAQVDQPTGGPVLQTVLTIPAGMLFGTCLAGFTTPGLLHDALYREQMKSGWWLMAIMAVIGVLVILGCLGAGVSFVRNQRHLSAARVLNP